MTADQFGSRRASVEKIDSLLSFWAFGDPQADPLTATGSAPIALTPGDQPVEFVAGGIFGEHSVRLGPGQWLYAPRDRCGPLARMAGRDAKVTLCAWLRRAATSEQERLQTIPQPVPEGELRLFLCEAVAGMWNESCRQRQYAMFVNLQLFGQHDNICGHVSATGGPTPGHGYCTSAAIGATEIRDTEWHFAAITYDGTRITAWLDGRQDTGTHNPYAYPEGIFDPGDDGADFTVGAVDRKGQMGNWFHGDLAGLAVFGTALTADEIALLHTSTR